MTETGRYATPTGEPCPRAVRVDGTLEGSGECTGCGHCLGLQDMAWPEQPGAGTWDGGAGPASPPSR